MKKSNAEFIVDDINRAIKEGMIKARVEGNEIVIQLHPTLNLTLIEEHGGGSWHVNDGH